MMVPLNEYMNQARQQNKKCKVKKNKQIILKKLLEIISIN